IRVELYGSLAKTGKGHGTDVAVMMGLSGEDPVTCDVAKIQPGIDGIRQCCQLVLAGVHPIEFDPAIDIVFHSDKTLGFHPNGLTFSAVMEDGSAFEQTYFSIGGGFVVQQDPVIANECPASLPLPIETGCDLASYSESLRLTIPQIVRTNERIWR